MLTPILMYHEIGDGDGLSSEAYASWTVTPAAFREHLARLAQEGFTGMSVARWLEWRRKPSTERPVVITFDDGFAGNIDQAFPALQAAGWTATFFVVSGKMGRPGYAGADGWRRAAEGGMDVASHTVTHPFLGALPREAVRRELLDSRLALEDAAGAPVRGLSWPNGDPPRGGRSLLAECGYQWAATSRAGFAGPRTDAHALPRLAVRSWHNAEGLVALMDCGFRNRFRLGATGWAKRTARLVLGRSRYAGLQMKVSGDTADR